MMVPVFNPSTQETEAEESQVQSQPGPHSEILSQKQNKAHMYIYSVYLYKGGMMAQACSSSYLGGRSRRIT
jgi:hypothetical protein